MINEDTFENNKKLLQGTAKGTLDITKDLKWNLSLSYQDEQYIWNEYHTSESQYNTRNGEAKRIATENKKKILETYINYDHTFANIHKLGLMAGYQRNRMMTMTVSVSMSTTFTMITPPFII